jgi:hypothetical protein
MNQTAYDYLEKGWHGDGGAVVESFSRVVSDVYSMMKDYFRTCAEHL